jgi:hypothetical protein
MSLFTLKEWLGHRRLELTQWYAKVTPDKLTETYLDARYLERKSPSFRYSWIAQRLRTELPRRARLTSTFIWGVAIARILIGRNGFIAWPVSVVSSTCQAIQQKHRHSKRMLLT